MPGGSQKSSSRYDRMWWVSRMQPRHQHAAAGGTDRRSGEGVGVTDSRSRQLVEVRSGDIFLAVTAEIVGKVLGNDPQDVGLSRIFRQGVVGDGDDDEEREPYGEATSSGDWSEGHHRFLAVGPTAECRSSWKCFGAIVMSVGCRRRWNNHGPHGPARISTPSHERTAPNSAAFGQAGRL